MRPAGLASLRGSGSRRLLAAALLGVFSGFFAGMFGVGGGILMVPALVLVLRVDQRLAHGTSPAAIVPIAALAVVGYAVAQSIDWATAGLITLGSAGGVVLGTLALHRLPQPLLCLGFSVFLVATVACMFFNVGSTNGRPEWTVSLSVAVVVIGIVAGALAGLLGVGGGLVTVPAMILLLSMRNVSGRNADLVLAAVLGCAGAGTSFAACRLSLVIDARLSRVLFALRLVAVAMLLALSGRRALATDDAATESGRSR